MNGPDFGEQQVGENAVFARRVAGHAHAVRFFAAENGALFFNRCADPFETDGRFDDVLLVLLRDGIQQMRRRYGARNRSAQAAMLQQMYIHQRQTLVR